MADQLLILMKRGEATMNVPEGKVAAFEADGWKVIFRPEPPAPKAQAESVAVETPAEKPARKGKS